MSRRINFESMPIAHLPARKWLRANEVDPSMVPIAQEALVGDDTITLKVFVFSAHGKQIGPDGEPIVQEITVPLISAPENHGL